MVQRTHYYPYGAAFASSTGQDEQPYKFGGKELEKEHGLGEYDFVSRRANLALLGFTTMDALAEKGYHLSPYLYCAGNPLLLFDPDGRWGIPYFQKYAYDSNVALNYAKAVPNAAMNVFNGAFSVVNGTINDVSYITSEGFGAYGNAVVNDIKATPDRIVATAKEAVNYYTQTPAGQQVADAFSAQSLETALTITGPAIVGGAVASVGKGAGSSASVGSAVKTGGDAVEQVAVHGNSLKSPKPTWGYKLYSNDGTFLKNGITSKVIPESRYTKTFMLDKHMEKFPFPNRQAAWDWEFEQNQILRGPLNKNMH